MIMAIKPASGQILNILKNNKSKTMKRTIINKLNKQNKKYNKEYKKMKQNKINLICS